MRQRGVREDDAREGLTDNVRSLGFDLNTLVAKKQIVLDHVHISQRPTQAEGEQIIAAPTLIKKLPAPLRRFIGDMSQTERILLGLDVRATEKTPPPTPNH